MYVEDALGREKYFKTGFAETAGQIKDNDLKSFAQQLSQRHSEIFNSFYNLL
jgi:hypothetical protein